MLKIGFLAEDEDACPWLFNAFDFAEGWCALENRSEVALGMGVHLKQINQHLTLLSGRVASPAPISRAQLYTTLLVIWGLFSTHYPLPPILQRVRESCLPPLVRGPY